MADVALCSGYIKVALKGYNSFWMESYLSDNSMRASGTVGLAFSSAHGYDTNEPFRFAIQMYLIHA